MIWLVRHGESTANAGAVTSDFDAIPLTGRGRAQAEAVAAAGDVRPDWVGLSAYRRARETAAPLLGRYPGVPTVELAAQEFTYLSPSRCAGLDPAGRQPLVDAYWDRMDPNHRDGDGAESFADLLGRVGAFLDEAGDRGGFGVVFTHEQFIRGVVLASAYPGEGPSTTLMRRFFAMRAGLPIPNAAICRVRREAGRWWFGGVDTAHLPGGTA